MQNFDREEELKPRCEFCGRTTDDVALREDPFDSDVNDNHAKHWMCNSCRDKRADDI